MQVWVEELRGQSISVTAPQVEEESPRVAQA